MWRQTSSRGSRDPLQGLSDEELDEVTYNNDCSANLQFLYSQATNKLPVMSQLELLKEDHAIYDDQQDTIGGGKPLSSLEYKARKQGFKREVHDFLQSSPRKENRSDSGDDSISDEENAVHSNFSITSGSALAHKTNHHKIETENQDEACTWSSVLEEADKLISLQRKKNSSLTISSTCEARKICKGGGDKAKLKFSIHSRSYNEVLCWPSEVKNEKEKSFERVDEHPTTLKDLESTIIENSMADEFEDLQDNEDEWPINLVVPEETGATPSVAEMLEDLQEKYGPFNGPDDLFLRNVRPKQRKNQVSGKRTSSYLGTRVLDNEDIPVLMDGGTSSDDEITDQNDLNITTQKVKTRTMADLFQEAFIMGEIDENLCCSNKKGGTDYYRRLQQAMQNEKDRNLEFSKQLQAGKSTFSASRCIDVQILSRSLEAKLTVCHCLFSECTKSSHCWKGPQTTDCQQKNEGSIIFSSKICDIVDLEVGNWVRIHWPWKEVHINEDEKIVLCTYFSQIMA